MSTLQALIFAGIAIYTLVLVLKWSFNQVQQVGRSTEAVIQRLLESRRKEIPTKVGKTMPSSITLPEKKPSTPLFEKVDWSVYEVPTYLRRDQPIVW